MEYYEHNPGDHEDPVAGPTWLMGIIGAVLLVVIIFGLTAMYYNAQGEQSRAQRYDRDPFELREYKQQQAQLLHGEPRWVTEQANEQQVRRRVIPIDEAMDLLVQQSGR